MKLKTTLVLGTAFAAFGLPALAQDFAGYTLRVKLIGGAQYEPLYAEIPKWEAATGAKVEIVSSKNHFELDKEIKQDIAAGTLDWCVGSNHTPLIAAEDLAAFVPLMIQHSTVNGRLVQLPRHSDVSNFFYQKSLYEDEAKKTDFKAKYGYDLAPPETWVQVKDQAIFFSNPPDFYGFQFVGKDEAITGRFYELLVANGGAMFDDKWNPTFNSDAGVEALSFFVDLYNAKAVPAGVPNYTWDDTGLGFGSGSIAMNLDWGGWSSYFNDPANSKVAGNVGLIRAPMGSGGKRTGWSGSHSFSITEGCDNKEAAASFLTFLTSYDNQMVEARKGLLPTRTKVWDDAIAEFTAAGNTFSADTMTTFKASMSEDAFTPPLIPEWIEVSNVLWPKLQAAMVGDMEPKAALDAAAAEAATIMKDAGYN
jgi:multiple sugar transport system substrate-binding protein